jgi:hypothetical protein
MTLLCTRVLAVRVSGPIKAGILADFRGTDFLLLTPRADHSVPQSTEDSIHRMIAAKAGKHRRSAATHHLQRSTNTGIAPCRNEPLFERRDGILVAFRMVIQLREIQIELGMVALYFESITTELLAKFIPLLDNTREQAHIRKVKRIEWFYLKSATDVSECDILILVVKMA